VPAVGVAVDRLASKGDSARSTSRQWWRVEFDDGLAPVVADDRAGENNSRTVKNRRRSISQ